MGNTGSRLAVYRRTEKPPDGLISDDHPVMPEHRPDWCRPAVTFGQGRHRGGGTAATEHQRPPFQSSPTNDRRQVH